MTHSSNLTDNARVRDALLELQRLITDHYPTAAYALTHGDDPEGMYLTVTVDVADVDEVVDVFIARLVEMQVDDDLPIYVIPVEPPARVATGQSRPVRPEAYATTAPAAS